MVLSCEILIYRFPFLCCLDMNLREIYEQVLVGFRAQGRQWGSLRELEAGDKSYRTESLGRNVGRRLTIATFIDDQVDRLGSFEEAMELCEDLMIIANTNGKRKRCSNNQFADLITKGLKLDRSLVE